MGGKCGARPAGELAAPCPLGFSYDAICVSSTGAQPTNASRPWSGNTLAPPAPGPAPPSPAGTAARAYVNWPLIHSQVRLSGRLRGGHVHQPGAGHVGADEHHRHGDRVGQPDQADGDRHIAAHHDRQDRRQQHLQAESGINAANKPTAMARATECRLRCQRFGSCSSVPRNRKDLCSLMRVGSGM